MANELLRIDRLNVRFSTDKGEFKTIKDVSFHIRENEVVGLVGESGCGKSVTSLALMGLLPANARSVSEQMRFQGSDLSGLDEKGWMNVRGNRISMIFQEPMTSLNPLIPVGRQVAEGLIRHRGLSAKQAKAKALEVMQQVELPRAEQLYDNYPHQLSGGMRQRVVIAMALVCGPQLLIADEPTTALDVTVQAQILALLKTIHSRQNTSILFISHDLGVIFNLCQRIIVMYAGHIVEEADKASLSRRQLHPYTKGLIESLPTAEKKGKPLYTMPGFVPSIQEEQKGCPFAPRCPKADKRCHEELPQLEEKAPGHQVRCHFPNMEAIV